MKLDGMKIGMLVGPGFENLELWSVWMRMKEEGADIKVMGLNRGGTYRSKSDGLDAVADYQPGDLSAEDLNALLVPGGWAPDSLRRVRKYLDLIRELHGQSKILGFVCHAGWQPVLKLSRGAK